MSTVQVFRIFFTFFLIYIIGLVFVYPAKSFAACIETANSSACFNASEIGCRCWDDGFHNKTYCDLKESSFETECTDPWQGLYKGRYHAWTCDFGDRPEGCGSSGATIAGRIAEWTTTPGVWVAWQNSLASSCSVCTSDSSSYSCPKGDNLRLEFYRENGTKIGDGWANECNPQAY